MGNKAIQRLQSMLTEEPLSTGEKTRWLGLERNPFENPALKPDDRTSGSSSDDRGSLADFPQEAQIDQLEKHAAELEKSDKEPSVKETTRVTDMRTTAEHEAKDGGHRDDVEAFQDAVNEAKREAEQQLRAALERIRKEEADRHSVELTRVREELADQHADDLQRARSAVLDSFNDLTGSILRNI